MSWIDLIILSVVQGVAEFLPISSSGHLVIFEELLGVEADQTALNIALHFGTLMSILLFYWKRVCELCFEDRRVIPLLVIGTIPAAVLGVTLKYFFDEFLESALLAGLMLPITGLVLLWVAGKQPGEGEYRELSVRRVLVIGTFQAAALLPGLSRSGLTISAGLHLGLSKRSASTFAFLLAIPAILGATVLEFRGLLTGDLDVPDWPKLVVGALIAFIVGWGSLLWLVRLLERGRLHYFAFWCIPVGMLVVIWQVVERVTA